MNDDRAALADQMHEAAPSWDQHRQSHYWQDYADAILGEHGRFLPDGDCGHTGSMYDRMDAYRAENERLRTALQSLMDHYATPYVEHPDGDGCWEAAEAALSPEPKS